jgi:hypothetical protein
MEQNDEEEEQKEEQKTLKKLKLSSEKEEKEEEIPNHFICPITREIMQDPVCIDDGSVYERHAIKKWFTNNETSPLTNLTLEHCQVCTNKALLQEIKASKWSKLLPVIPQVIKDSQHCFTSGQSGLFAVVYYSGAVFIEHATVVFVSNKTIQLNRNQKTRGKGCFVLGTYDYNPEKDCYVHSEDIENCYVFCLKEDYKHYRLIDRLYSLYAELDGKLDFDDYLNDLTIGLDSVIIGLLGYKKNKFLSQLN